MKYLSLFSGIEAASVAWGPLGWQAAAFAEVDPFASAVLAHRFPGVPNLGDVSRIDGPTIESLGPIDVVVFGFPCQDLSVTGLRKGLKDDAGNATRSGLFHEATRIVRLAAERCGCRWLLVENVPGLFTSSGGRDFAEVIRATTGLAVPVPPAGWGNGGVAAVNGPGWSAAWRCLDAQFFGVPQRRRRLFLVGHRGGCWRRPAAALFEPGGLSLDPRPGGPVGPPAAPGPGGLPGGRGRIFGWTGDTTPKYGVGVTPTLRASQGGEGVGLAGPFGVRRLTAVEAERLQGFPDGYTDVPFRGRPAGHAPRLKALGNSFAVPVVRWIGERIATVDCIPGGSLD
jgi:DNA (cytosine-5)-methyltransferase 1